MFAGLKNGWLMAFMNNVKCVLENVYRAYKK